MHSMVLQQKKEILSLPLYALQLPIIEINKLLCITTFHIVFQHFRCHNLAHYPILILHHGIYHNKVVIPYVGEVVFFGSPPILHEQCKQSLIIVEQTELIGGIAIYHCRVVIGSFYAIEIPHTRSAAGA